MATPPPAAAIAWLEGMGVRGEGWHTYAHHFDQMPPDVQAAWGQVFSARERAALAQIRERRRMFAEHAPDLSPETQRIARPALWQALVASAEGEQDDEEDVHMYTPKRPMSAEPAEGPLSTHGNLHDLHTKYLAEVDAAPPPLENAPADLVDMFRRTVHAMFVRGELDVPADMYMCDFDERWDDPRARGTNDDDAWLEEDD